MPRRWGPRRAQRPVRCPGRWQRRATGPAPQRGGAAAPGRVGAEAPPLTTSVATRAGTATTDAATAADIHRARWSRGAELVRGFTVFKFNSEGLVHLGVVWPASLRTRWRGRNWC